MASIFTKIVNGEIPCNKILEDENYLAFLDISPLTKGHVLVIIKDEIDDIFDIQDDLLAGMFVFAKKVAKALKLAFPCKKIGVAVLGLEVPHAHIHLVPLQSEQDINFSNPKLSLPKEEMINIANSIKEKLS